MSTEFCNTLQNIVNTTVAEASTCSQSPGKPQRLYNKRLKYVTINCRKKEKNFRNCLYQRPQNQVIPRFYKECQTKRQILFFKEM